MNPGAANKRQKGVFWTPAGCKHIHYCKRSTWPYWKAQLQSGMSQRPGTVTVCLPKVFNLEAVVLLHT